ncbi:hypothetical protein LX32DRAFT_682670 [Colletotrichum zoysiae]|uniref:Uncharacterized protein n=1 Tax=Colletotrichum zoysiae TaxID=1216348 RepID=A0AAD9M0C5_9PEZI|nr:hypothetical protein LX32DRAFT_682670 [Colletotrichum zoysiae]
MAARKPVAKPKTARKTVAKTTKAAKAAPKKNTAKTAKAKKNTAPPRAATAAAAAAAAPAKDTTAHALSAALRSGEVPTDPSVLADFGFDRCFSGPDRAHLSMVYAALMIDLEVRPNELNKWLAGDGRGGGGGGGGGGGLKRVGDRIRARFAAAAAAADKPGGGGGRTLRPGPHLAWFRDHRYVWDDDDAAGRAKARAAAARMVKKKLAALRNKVKKGDRDEVFDWWS